MLKNEEQIYRDIQTLQEQVRALKEQNAQLEKKITDEVGTLNSQIFQNAPPVVNYINNGDFVFEQEDYEPGSNYTDDHLDCALWYQNDSTDTAQVVEHTTTVRSNDRISTDTALQTYWDKTSGQLVYGSRCAVYHPLPKNLAFPASSLFCRFQVKKFSGAVSLTGSWRLRASIWDNTAGQQKIIEGAPFDISANPAVGSPGAFTRKYLLRVDTPMDFFYSDVLTPVQVTNQVSVTNIDNINFVTVTWQTFAEAAKYTLYRHDSEFNEWRVIAEIVNGATTFRDVGGRTGNLHIPPVANILPRAQALFVNFGSYVTPEYQDAIFHIFIPTSYSYAATTNKQWLRIDMVDENLTLVTLPDDALVFDKVSLGYTNGRFTYSGRDLQANAAVAATTPPPVPVPGGDDGDGGNVPPPRGRGDRPFCVKPDTLILMDGGEWRKAIYVEVGNKIISGDGKTSKVVEVITGTTTQFRVITTQKGRELWCTPSHRIIRKVNDPEGTPAFLLKVGDQVMAMDEKYGLVFDVVEAIEVLSVQDHPVVTFKLEGTHTYVAAGIVSHNLKPVLE